MDFLDDEIISTVGEKYIKKLEKENEKLKAVIKKLNIDEINLEGIEIDDDKFPWK